MRIAQVAPLYESVPPWRYGGTERIVSYLTEELHRLGHDVTLYAAGNSRTGARLVQCCPQALRLDPQCLDPLAVHFLMLEQVFRDSPRYDIVHYHVDYLHYPLSRRMDTAHVTTLHGRLDIPQLRPLYEEYGDMPAVSISNAQRFPLPMANWQGTVHHGLPEGLYRLHDEPGSYLAFLGRVSPEKRLDRAVQIARRTGMRLRIAAKIDKADQNYFDQHLRPLLDHPLIEFIGEVGDQDKDAFLGHAAALLFPIDWPEPFGLAMIEALACGTPVIAYPHGSVPEIVEHGVTGFIVSNQDQAVSAVQRLSMLDRRQCRRSFERRFSAGRMAADYLTIYNRLTRAWADSLAVAQ